MPDWFTPTVVILGLLALALFVAFWTTRNRKYAAGVLALLGLIAVAWLIAHFLPTDRKAIESAIDDMAAGVRNRNPDQVFTHFAKNFRFRSFDNKAFRDWAAGHIRAGTVDDILILGYDKVEISRAAKKADLEFRVKPIGPITGDTFYYLCRAKFVLEDDGKWRMQTFELYNPFMESNRAIDIPGLN
jgi:hypothetical protein